MIMSAIGTKRTYELVHCTCLLLGVKRTCHFALQMSAYDPKRTLAVRCGNGACAAYNCAEDFEATYGRWCSLNMQALYT